VIRLVRMGHRVTTTDPVCDPVFFNVSNSIKDRVIFLLGSLVLVFPSFANGPYVTSSRRYVTSLPTSRVIRLVRMGHRDSTCPGSWVSFR